MSKRCASPWIPGGGDPAPRPTSGSDGDAGRTFGLRELFSRLDRWWLERHLEDLHVEIRESERSGDTERNISLCLRRAEVTRLRHKRLPGSDWAYKILLGDDCRTAPDEK